jgi:hypothetical protein
MSTVKGWLMTLVVGYTLALLGIEYRFGQDYARNYFSDISGPVRFFAVNTTLSNFLLWAIALLFFVCWLWARETRDEPKRQLFYGFQVLIFAYLGADERFTLHEWLGYVLNCNDAWFLLAVGLLEVAVLVFPGEILKQPRRAKLYLSVAVVLFGVMLLFDVFAPKRMLLRLSIEDLTKLWSDVFLLLFAWEICKQQLGRLVAAGAGSR